MPVDHALGVVGRALALAGAQGLDVALAGGRDGEWARAGLPVRPGARRPLRLPVVEITIAIRRLVVVGHAEDAGAVLARDQRARPPSARTAGRPVVAERQAALQHRPIGLFARLQLQPLGAVARSGFGPCGPSRLLVAFMAKTNVRRSSGADVPEHT